mgnify:CR=1 FL=1
MLPSLATLGATALLLSACGSTAKKADAGYAGITWSKDWGGRGGSAIQQVIYDQEEAKYAIPRGIFEIGLGMCMPTLWPLSASICL